MIKTRLTQYICSLSQSEQDKLLAKARRNIERLVEESEIDTELEMVRNSRICDIAEFD